MNHEPMDFRESPRIIVLLLKNIKIKLKSNKSFSKSTISVAKVKDIYKTISVTHYPQM